MDSWAGHRGDAIGGLKDDLFLGDCLSFNSVEQFSQDRFYVFPNIAGHKDKEQVVPWKKTTGTSFDYYVINTWSFKVFLA